MGYNVDLYLTGHQHNYQRFFPTDGMGHSDTPTDMAMRRCHDIFQSAAASQGGALRAQPFPSLEACVHEHSISNHTFYNPKYMTTVVLGSPGCQEHVAHSWGPEELTAVKVADYGYGHLRVFNRTHLYLDWELIADDVEMEFERTPVGDKHETVDHLWIIKN